MNDAWYLESIAADGSRVKQPIRQWPLRIGREADNGLVVPLAGLSRQHAELACGHDGRLRLTDLGSTNGSYVNGRRAEGSTVVGEDDVLIFGTAEYRLGLQRGPEPLPPARDDDADDRTQIVQLGAAAPQRFVPHERQFMELLTGRGLSAAVQPIVDAAGRQLFAYELLGRSEHPELPLSPAHLFALAARLGREAELSEAFRAHGVTQAAPRLRGARLFVNTHPAETFSDEFFAALRRLRALPQPPELVVEIHETAVMEVARMRELAAQLAGIGVAFAYDDFGAGQARLNELGEVPAHYVKFDMALVRDLDSAPASKQRVVRDLVRLVRDLGSVPLAEGVETEAEAAVCREMGFSLFQGWLTGRPIPIRQL